MPATKSEREAISDELAALEASASNLRTQLDLLRKRDEPKSVLKGALGAGPMPPLPEDDQFRKELEEFKTKYAPIEQAVLDHIKLLSSLKSDIELIVRKESKMSFWGGFWVNALFFVLGLVVSAVTASFDKIVAALRIS
ncbi:MAG: hypothetical protein AB1586_09965 [Pseudomonadota bacterium]|jgi:hypothetical protein